MRSPALRHVITHLITPLLMCIGMGLAYMGAFVTPAPHHLPVGFGGCIIFIFLYLIGFRTKRTF